jgi:hypothetical protein
MFLLLMALVFGVNAFSDSDSSGGSTTRNVGETSNIDEPTRVVNPIDVEEAAPDVAFIEDDIPVQDFSIKQSCDEIYEEYMAAPPGSDEEQWALEAAEEVCFGQ